MNVKETLHRLKIPHSTVCQLADILPTEMSAFLRSRRAVSEVKAARIESITEELRQFLETDWPNAQAGLPVPFPLDLRDAPALRKWMDYVREIETQNAVDPDAVREIEKMYEGLGAE